MPNLTASARPRALPAVATLVPGRALSGQGAAGGAAPAGTPAWADGPHFADVQQLIASGFVPAAVLLSPGDAHQAAAWLESLRRDPRLALVPVVLPRTFGEGIDALSDAVASAGAAAESVAPIAQRAATLGRRETAEGEERLLAYLYLRPGLVLTPVADWHNERIYRYPLADALGRPGEEGFLLIERLRRRGLLETTDLIERVHSCPACSAGQLLFIETCPQCGSIDTTEQNFLHCYACGHVGTQEHYLSQEGLGCPKCSARLRHIGVDYDRALETLSCRACGGRFTEAAVKVRCLQCRRLSGTDELAERRYYGLRLSAAGELAARTGQVGDLFKLIDEFSHAHPEYFSRTLEWQLDLSRRHREVEFGLVCLRFSNVHQLTARLARHRVAQLFDALAQRLRALVRATDLFMRDDEEYCWLLLPQTPPPGVATLLERIVALGASAVPEDGQHIEIATADFSSAEADEGITDARMLMATLRNRAG